MDTHFHPRSPATPSQPPWVIRTFLVADIRGHTRFSDARGDEAAVRFAERFVSIARERVDRHAGAIVEVRGDEILAVFDSARQAVRAAVDLQEAITAEQTSDVPLAVGIGIDAGEAVPLGRGYRGDVLNMAARLCARARPGEILVTAELAHLSGAVEALRFEDRGPVRLKGISRPIHLLTVTRLPAPGKAPPTGDGIAAQFEFRLLGPLEVTEDGRSVPLGGPRQRLVLAHLLLAANRVLPMQELVDRVWDGEPPQAARNTIQSYVSHLRGALGADRIEGRAPGYMLHAEREELDALRFEQLLRRARRQLAVEPREAVATLGEALELWRGSPLSDLADAPSLAGEIARLQELHLTAVEDLQGARLSLGEHTEALPDLERLTVEHPLRERILAHLMLARYRSGRQADALECYRRAQELLADELGIDPSPELQELHRRILRQDPGLQLTGRPLRGYRLLERVGEGAFGVVRRALDPELGREVAIKQVHPQLADDSSFVRRFEREAQTIARLEHPHVVPLYDYWRDGSGAYLVMRWMRGGSLEGLLARGPLDPDSAMHVVDQVASALSAAHRVHTVHRDVKPANVLFDEEGNAYLSDFGIAEDLADWRDNIPSGSLGYHSPEQLRGEEVTPRSDIYGLGMLVQDLLDRRQGLPQEAAEVIARATAEDPKSRHRDARDLAVELRDALGLSVRRRSIRPGVEARNPYKGLFPFTEADAGDFFGRDALTDGLVDRLAEGVEDSRFLAIVGPSGSGKSSVVRAGLVPRLRRGALSGSDGWFYVEMLPGAHPMEELEAALLRIAVNPPRSLLELLERDEEGLSRMVNRLLPDDGTELVLVIDQLEEVFTMVEDEHARDHFLNSLVAAVRNTRARLRVVATLRADFYDRPLAYPGLAELMRRRSETVVPLTPEELERAIVGPADRVGVVPELALVAEMVADVSDRPGGLPLLQYALTELFDRRRDGVLTLEAYREIDGISGALVRRAEELFQGLTQPEREAAKQLFLRLVTPGEGLADARRLIPRAELMGLQMDRTTMEHVIDTFGRHRLISFDRDPATRGPTVEVAHEALLLSWERLRIWIDEARDDLRQHRRLATSATDWDRAGRDPSYLLAGGRLEQFATWAATTGLALTAAERDYLQLGREAAIERQRRLRRRRRSILGAFVAAALISLSLAGVAYLNERHARRSAAVAEQERTVADARALAASSLVEPHLDAALRQALAAVRLDNTAQTRSALLAGVLRSPTAARVMHGSGPLQSLAISPDGKTLVAAGGSGRLDVFDTRGGRRVGQPVTLSGSLGFACHCTEFSQDGRTLAVAEGPSVAEATSRGRTGFLELLDSGSWRVRARAMIERQASVEYLAWLPDGTGVAAVVGQWSGPTSSAVVLHKDVVFFDGTTGARTGGFRLTKRDLGGPTGMRFLADGTIVTSTGGGPTEVWDVRAGELKRVVEAGGSPLAVTRDGGTAVFGEFSGSLDVLDLPTGRVRRLQGPIPGNLPVNDVTFSPDESLLVTVGTDSKAKVWDVSTRTVVETLTDHVGFVNRVVFRPDGRVFYTCSQDGTVIAWAFPGQRGLVRSFQAAPATQNNSLVSVNTEGTVIAVRRNMGSVVLLDLNSLSSLGTIALPEGSTGALALSPNGRRLVTSGKDTTVELWDVRTRTLIERIGFGPKGSFAWVGAFSPDGKTFAIGSQDDVSGVVLDTSSFTVWNAATRRPMWTRKLDGGPVGVTFSSDGRYMMGLSLAAEPTVWDVSTGRMIFQSKSNPGSFSAAFSPDGRTVAIGLGGDISFWQFPSGRRAGPSLSTGPFLVIQLAISADGQLLASHDINGNAYLWDLGTQRRIGAALSGAAGFGALVAFLGGDRLVLGYPDGSGAVWDLDLHHWEKRACQVAGGPLTPTEWRALVPDQPYRDICS